jgi:hypothetical protein
MSEMGQTRSSAGQPIRWLAGNEQGVRSQLAYIIGVVGLLMVS